MQKRKSRWCGARSRSTLGLGRRGVEELVRGHVRIGQAMDGLATAWHSRKQFSALHEAVQAVYEAW